MVKITTSDDIRTDVTQIVAYGCQCRFRYFMQAIVGSTYDDDVYLTASGSDVWTSGLLQPIGGKSDYVLLQQGKLKYNDSKLYVTGLIDTDGTFRVGVGSPCADEYAISDGGVFTYDLEHTGSPAYKKIYLRRLTTGSLTGE